MDSLVLAAREGQPSLLMLVRPKAAVVTLKTVTNTIEVRIRWKQLHDETTLYKVVSIAAQLVR
jgi:hypothetical protein